MYICLSSSIISNKQNNSNSERTSLAAQGMNNFFLPTSRKVLPTFQTFCPVGVHFAQTVIPFAHFQVQARKWGVLGWGWGFFVYIHVTKGVCDG